MQQLSGQINCFVHSTCLKRPTVIAFHLIKHFLVFAEQLANMKHIVAEELLLGTRFKCIRSGIF